MWVHPNGVETTGALDLGGASTQISFAAGEKVGLNTSNIMKVSLYGYVYTLYTHSFQCYGRNEAEKRFLAILHQVPELAWGGEGHSRCSLEGLEGRVAWLLGSVPSTPAKMWIETRACFSFLMGVQALSLFLCCIEHFQ